MQKRKASEYQRSKMTQGQMTNLPSFTSDPTSGRCSSSRYHSTGSPVTRSSARPLHYSDDSPMDALTFWDQTRLHVSSATLPGGRVCSNPSASTNCPSIMTATTCADSPAISRCALSPTSQELQSSTQSSTLQLGLTATAPVKVALVANLLTTSTTLVPLSTYLRIASQTSDSYQNTACIQPSQHTLNTAAHLRQAYYSRTPRGDNPHSLTMLVAKNVRYLNFIPLHRHRARSTTASTLSKCR